MWRLIAAGLVELLWPLRTDCLLCRGSLSESDGSAAIESPGQNMHYPICDICWRAMPFHPDLPRCGLCARPVPGEEDYCIDCAPSQEGTGPSPFGRVTALGMLIGPLREMVHHLKFNGREDIGPLLGRRLGGLVPERAYDGLVPVPLHRSRFRERGYNQAGLIAQGIGLQRSLPVWSRGLVRRRSTGHQAKLDRQGRLGNLAGAFGVSAAPAPWTGRRVLLVDDVLTTGATVATARTVLLRSGAALVDVAVLAVSATPVQERLKLPINSSPAETDS